MTGHITVGLSGGVDSAVAAMLLKRQGETVRGLFMKNWEEDDSEQYCAAETDLADVRAVCASIGIEFDAVNFASEYWNDVFERFLTEYRAGRTPNPDIWCNQFIKFDAFLEHALDRGAQAIATGHYARIGRDAVGRACLLRAADSDKDQSYFLYALGQRQLRHARFPLGEMRKSAVRDLAREAGIPVHDKRDSTGICFIGERPFREFLARYLPAQPGPMQSPDGERLGQHQGLMFYTLGQRQGLGIGGRTKTDGAPWYVVDKDLKNNVLIVAQGHDHPRLFCKALVAGELTWVAGEAPALPGRLTAKIRYRQVDQPCIVEQQGEQLKVRFDTPQRAVTPGQSVVLYSGDVCLGGGIIQERLS